MTKQAKSFMSAAMDSFTETIHVRLLDEGVEVWRPVRARALGKGVFELSSDAAPDDEVWEFAPGEKVAVAKRRSAQGEPFSAAVALQQVQPRRRS